MSSARFYNNICLQFHEYCILWLLHLQYVCVSSPFDLRSFRSPGCLSPLTPWIWEPVWINWTRLLTFNFLLDVRGSASSISSLLSYSSYSLSLSLHKIQTSLPCQKVISEACAVASGDTKFKSHHGLYKNKVNRKRRCLQVLSLFGYRWMLSYCLFCSCFFFFYTDNDSLSYSLKNKWPKCAKHMACKKYNKTLEYHPPVALWGCGAQSIWWTFDLTMT